MKPFVLAIVGLFCMAAGFVLSIIVPDLKAYAMIITAIGLALVVLSAVMDLRHLKKTIASRKGRFGLSLSVRIACVCAIVILVNSVSRDVFYRFDLTGLSQFTLASQTRKTLG